MKATVTEIKKRVKITERKADGIFNYDVDNDYPSRVLDIVAGSSMGRACLDIYRKFIFGKGFANEQLAAAVLNRWNDTGDKILAKVARDYGAFGGFALHVNWNAAFQITDIAHIPFEQIRRTTPDNKEHPNVFAVSKTWGVRFDRKKIKYIDPWDTNPDHIQQSVERAGGWNAWAGQIFYYSNEDEMYPLPIYDAALEDMETDLQTKLFKFRNVTTNFMASHLIITDPMESAEIEGTQGRGAGDEKSTFIENMEDYQGADNAMKLLLIEKTHPDQTFDIKKIDQQTGDRLYEWTEGSTRDNIRQAFFLPAVLLMQTAGKLGTADEIIDGTKYYNAITEDERLTLEAAFSYVAEFFVRPLGDDFSINPREAIRKEDIPATIMPDLTRNERRALAGYPEIQDGATQTLAEKLGVGGTQSFTAILGDPNMSDDQKRGSLKILFSLDDVQVNEIIKPQPAGTPAAQPAAS